eukprot:12931946-Prorocentrum_lima.AAC.1
MWRRSERADILTKEVPTLVSASLDDSRCPWEESSIILLAWSRGEDQGAPPARRCQPDCSDLSSIDPD